MSMQLNDLVIGRAIKSATDHIWIGEFVQIAWSR